MEACGSSHHRAREITKLGHDVALCRVAACVIDADGGAVLERSFAREIWDIAQCIFGFDTSCLRIGFEAGAMSQHFSFGLRTAGFDFVCMEARQVNAAFSAMRNRTDTTDARGIAQVLRSGWFNPVLMKSREVHAVRALLGRCKAVQRKRIDLANDIRGLFRIFGLRLPSRVDQSSFDERVRATIEADPDLSHELTNAPKIIDGIVAHRTRSVPSQACKYTLPAIDDAEHDCRAT